MAKKLNQALKEAFEKEVGRVKLATAASADTYGAVIVNEIKNSAAIGLSPIEGKGRFPAYKAVAAAKTIQKLIRSARGRKASKDKIAGLKESLKDRKAGYPASVQKDFPNKRNRPVNLYLSGKMLADLTYEKLKTIAGVEIGYFDRESQLKEQGHREGANGQPKRPTIPIGSEKFSIRILKIAAAAFEKSLARKLRKA